MRWLIDGYNVIRRDPDLRGAEASGLEAGRRALLARLAVVARRSADRFTVIFDGAPGHAAAAGGQLEVLFSRPPDKADDVLIRLARQAGAGAAVVTSDRMVQDAARRAGCAVLAADVFVGTLASDDDDTDKREAEDEEDERVGAKRGNPRRLSRDERAARRALRRLRGFGRS